MQVQTNQDAFLRRCEGNRAGGPSGSLRKASSTAEPPSYLSTDQEALPGGRPHGADRRALHRLRGFSHVPTDLVMY